MSENLRDRCQGKWRGMLPQLGVDSRHLSGKHGPCPACDGTDRFRFDDKDGRGTYICSHCGAGDGFSLLMIAKRIGFKEAAELVEGIVGSVPRENEKRQDRSEKSLREAMNALWGSGRPITDLDVAGRYLSSRNIHMAEYPSALRFVERCRYQAETPTWHPAMLAKVVGPDGIPATIHRTYLDPMGGKLRSGEARKVMPGKIAKGSAVRLGDHGATLGIAEGIETALSASIVWSMPCWAALNAGMLMSWEPPAGVTEVFVFGDNDRSYAGQQAAYALAHRLSATRGITVRVELPVDVGMDWNDVLRAESQVAA